MTDGETGGFLERLRNSPRTVSTIIVILIVVGAIFAFSDRGSQPGPSPASGETQTPTTEVSPSPEPEGAEATPTPEGEEAVKAEEPEATPEPTPMPLPEAQETDEAYIEVAARGDGVTHLARRALLKSLESNKPDFEVTAERKVWMEDYIKDQVGRAPLAVGENKTIEKSVVREAVEKSKNLTDAQLKNLQRYSRLVAAYR